MALFKTYFWLCVQAATLMVLKELYVVPGIKHRLTVCETSKCLCFCTFYPFTILANVL